MKRAENGEVVARKGTESDQSDDFRGRGLGGSPARKRTEVESRKLGVQIEPGRGAILIDKKSGHSGHRDRGGYYFKTPFQKQQQQS